MLLFMLPIQNQRDGLINLKNWINVLKRRSYKQLGSAILFSKEITKYFLSEGKGNLIHISSIQGIRAPKFDHYIGTEMSSPIEYAAIKAGIIAITKWLAKYYKNNGMRINCISPGGIKDNQPDSFLSNYKKDCNNIGMLILLKLHLHTFYYLMIPWLLTDKIWSLMTDGFEDYKNVI